MASEGFAELLAKHGEITHYGVKGMRWGTRRKVGPDGRVVGKTKPNPSTDFKTTAPLRKRPPHTLSNMQLKKVNERMQLESKFNKMNPSRKQKGKEFVEDSLKAAGVAGVAGGIVALAKNPKTRETIANGAKVLASATSKEGRLLREVGKGTFGGAPKDLGGALLKEIGKGRFG